MRRAPFILAAALFALDAAATPSFPSTIRAVESLSYVPDCSLCHRGTPAVGTVTTPFGISMRQRGLRMYDDPSLRAALAAMEAERVDSDGDGVADIDELRAGTNPNVGTLADGGAAPSTTDFPEPSYGVGCATGAGSAQSAALVALAAIAALAVRRRPWPIRVSGGLHRVKRHLREKKP